MVKKISINEAVISFKNGTLVSSGYDLSTLVVINPIDFDMSKPKILTESFGFVHNTTNENIAHSLEKCIEEWLTENTQKNAIFTDLDDFKQILIDLSKRKGGDWGSDKMIAELINNMLQLLLINCCLEGGVSIKSFTVCSKKLGDVFWIYAGIEKLTDKKILEAYEKKIDYLEKNNTKNSKSFNIIVSER